MIRVNRKLYKNNFIDKYAIKNLVKSRLVSEMQKTYVLKYQKLVMPKVITYIKIIFDRL